MFDRGSDVALLKWYALFGVPKAFTSDGMYFTGRVMPIMPLRQGVFNHFVVANALRRAGQEGMNSEIMKTFRAVLNERLHPRMSGGGGLCKLAKGLC